MRIKQLLASPLVVLVSLLLSSVQAPVPTFIEGGTTVRLDFHDCYQSSRLQATAEDVDMPQHHQALLLTWLQKIRDLENWTPRLFIGQNSPQVPHPPTALNPGDPPASFFYQSLPTLQSLDEQYQLSLDDPAAISGLRDKLRLAIEEYTHLPVQPMLGQATIVDYMRTFARLMGVNKVEGHLNPSDLACRDTFFTKWPNFCATQADHEFTQLLLAAMKKRTELVNR